MEQYEPAEYKTLLSESDASVLQEYMRYVVEEGTATKLKSDSYEAPERRVRRSSHPARTPHIPGLWDMRITGRNRTSRWR